MHLSAQMVVDFHEKFGIQYDGPPRDISLREALFREMRQQEETSEFVEARMRGDRTGQLDAIVDMIYIALGTAHLMGFKPEVIMEAFERVHEKNMQKELSHEGNPSKYGTIGVGRDIVKPPGWTPPDLSDLAYPEHNTQADHV